MCSQAAQSLWPNEKLSTQNDATHYYLCLFASLSQWHKESSWEKWRQLVSTTFFDKREVSHMVWGIYSTYQRDWKASALPLSLATFAPLTCGQMPPWWKIFPQQSYRLMKNFRTRPPTLRHSLQMCFRTDKASHTLPSAFCLRLWVTSINKPMHRKVTKVKTRSN